jgi:hypothetical protein
VGFFRFIAVDLRQSVACHDPVDLGVARREHLLRTRLPRREIGLVDVVTLAFGEPIEKHRTDVAAVTNQHPKAPTATLTRPGNALLD